MNSNQKFTQATIMGHNTLKLGQPKGVPLPKNSFWNFNLLFPKGIFKEETGNQPKIKNVVKVIFRGNIIGLDDFIRKKYAKYLPMTFPQSLRSSPCCLDKEKRALWTVPESCPPPLLLALAGVRTEVWEITQIPPQGSLHFSLLRPWKVYVLTPL